MDETTRMIVTRLFQLFMLVPVIFAFRQLYKDVYDHKPDTHKDPDQD
jgi:hypothetical protein